MISAGTISWLYVLFGILAAGLVSVASYRLKLIEEKSELLYLSFGFYRHFFRIYFGSFFSAIQLVINLAFTNKQIKPVVYSINFNYKDAFNPALLMASFNMTTGLFCIGIKDDNLVIHAIDTEHFKKFNMSKTLAALGKVNDDNIV